MLILCVLLIDLFKKNSFSLRKLSFLSVFFPAFVFSALISIYLIWQAFSLWPEPRIPLDVTDLVHTHSVTGLNWSEDESEDSTAVVNIPPELYPDTEFISQHPVLIATGSLPLEKWNRFTPQETKTGKIDVEITISPTPEITKKSESKIPPIDGLNHTVQVGESIWDISKEYGIQYRKLVLSNPSINPRRMMPGDKIFIPGAGEKPYIPRTQEPMIRDLVLRNAKTAMLIPLDYSSIGPGASGYGMRRHPVGGNIRFHRGIDLPAKRGTPIYAALDGKVSFIGPKGGMGLMVELTHDSGLKTVYAHNNTILCTPGQKVKQGSIISTVGSSGYATGSHLHFEVWKDGNHQNPTLYLPQVKRLLSNVLLAREDDAGQ